MNKKEYRKPLIKTEGLISDDVIVASDMFFGNYDYRDNGVSVSDGGFSPRGYSLMPSFFE